jgi:hypothetical protein
MRVMLRLSTVGALLICVSQVHAGLIITPSTGWSTSTPTVGWPTTPAVTTTTGPGEFGTERGTGSGRNTFQTFQVGATFQLDKVFVPYQDANPNDTFTLRIFAVNDVNAVAGTYTSLGSGFSGTSLLLSVAAALPASGFTGAVTGVMEFDLTDSDQIMLPAISGAAGYALQIFGDIGTPAFNARLTTSGQNSLYASGRVYEWNGAAWAPVAVGADARDIAFSMTSVPEPSLWIVIGTGLTAATWSAAFRRK